MTAKLVHRPSAINWQSGKATTARREDWKEAGILFAAEALVH
jgi:hypothetical protein